MANPYFRNLPDFEYVNRTTDGRNISDYTTVKNFFKKGKLREDIFQNIAFFDKYYIRGNDRPDNVANDLYGDPTLDWIVLSSNNILNIQSEWPMDQLSFDDLLNSEQSSITGLNKLSGFTSGSISGDESWYFRGQVNRNYYLSKDIKISPYLYGAAGVAYTLTPTEVENRATAAKSIGLGLEVSGNDKYFFDKRISARVEYSKNWATGKLEDLSDVRLNKQHLLVSMAMNF